MPTIRNNSEKLLPTAQVAEMCKVSQMTLGSMRMRKEFPEPKVRGWFRETEVEAWVADRRRGLPLPSGRILQAWAPIAALAGKLIDLHTTCALARTSEATLRMWVRRGDFPKSSSKGHWLTVDVEKWVADRKAGKTLPYSLTTPGPWRPEITGGSYSSHDLQDMTRMGVTKIYDMMRHGDFPDQIQGHKGKWPKRAVNEWISARQRGEKMIETGRIPNVWMNEYRAAHPIPQTVELLSRQFADIYYANKLTPEAKAQVVDIFQWHKDFPAYLTEHGTQAELDEYNAAMRLNQSPHAQIARRGAPLPLQMKPSATNHPDCDPDDSDEVRANYPSAGEPDDPDMPESDEYGLDDL